jgi:hypothetical protein
MTRQEILRAAEDCVCRDRQATHGAPENSFGKLAAVWSARLGIPITPAQAAILLSDLKTVRAWDNPDHDDNWVDGAGYMACGGELAAAVKKSLTTQQPSKEPEPTVECQKWQNIYPRGIITTYGSRSVANERADWDRIAVQRIELMSDGTVRGEMEDV